MMLLPGRTYYLVLPVEYPYAVLRVRGYHRVYGGGSYAYTVDGVNGYYVVPFTVDGADEIVEDPGTYPLEPLDHIVKTEHSVPENIVDKYVVDGPVKSLGEIRPFIDGQLMLYGYRLKSMMSPPPVELRSLDMPVPEKLTPGRAVVFMLYMYKRLIDLSPEQPLNHFLRHAYKIQYLTAKFLKTGEHYRYCQRYIDWKYVADTMILHRVFNMVTSHGRLMDIYPYLTIGTEDMSVERLLPPQVFTEHIAYPCLIRIDRDPEGRLIVTRLEDTFEAQAQIARYMLARKLMIITRDTVKSILAKTGAVQ